MNTINNENRILYAYWLASSFPDTGHKTRASRDEEPIPTKITGKTIYKQPGENV